MYTAPYVAFDLNNYENEMEMMVDIVNVMTALVHNGYEVLFRYEDCGIYVVEFLPSDYSLGENRFMVVTPEEEEEIYFNRDNEAGEIGLIPADGIPDLSITPPSAGIDDPKPWPPVVDK